MAGSDQVCAPADRADDQQPAQCTQPPVRFFSGYNFQGPERTAIFISLAKIGVPIILINLFGCLLHAATLDYLLVKFNCQNYKYFSPYTPWRGSAIYN